MKERPILFSGAMVRAILAGMKTQTRRVGEWQKPGRNEPDPTELGVEYIGHSIKGFEALCTYRAYPGRGSARHALCACRFGIPGDRLWVREEHYQYGHWEPVAGVKTKGGKQKWKFISQGTFKFEAPETFRKGRHHLDPYTPAWHKRLARFMPKTYSRITLEIVNLRVERLQEISEADAEAEGVDFLRHHPDADETLTARDLYKILWEMINGESSWDKNPWVWVLEFKRVEVVA